MSAVTREWGHGEEPAGKASVAQMAGIDPESVKGFAVLIDDGSTQGIIVTNLDPLPLALFLSNLLDVLATGSVS